jgi:hypothetical protein
MLWPLIYDLNKNVVGPNPNRLQPGSRVVVRELSAFTPEQVADARRRGPSWRNYG